jgi:hypothetical protein
LLSKNLLQKNLHKRYFVTSKVGHNFSGVLIEHDRDQANGYSQFVDVEVHLPDGQVEDATTGFIYQPNSNIAHIQEIPAKIPAELVT